MSSQSEAVVMMGFEADRRVHRDFNNKPVAATVGGKFCTFRCEFEYRWAMYQQYRKDRGEILDWDYEVKSESYNFAELGYETEPFSYLPDFLLTENDGAKIVQECKGKLEAKDIEKFKRVQQSFPDDRLELVLYRIPKSGCKGATIRANAKRFVERIIDADAVFRATRNDVDYSIPWY